MCTIASATLAAALAATQVVSESRPTMGTLATVILAGLDPERAASGIETAFSVFERVDRTMNEWRPESPLSHLNARAGRGWVSLPADLCDVLGAAKRGAERTSGDRAATIVITASGQLRATPGLRAELPR